MCDKNKSLLPGENEPKKLEQQPNQPEKKEEDDAAVLYDASELSDDDLEGMSTEELEDTEGAGYFFVPVLVAANAFAAANAVAAANVAGVANANAMTNVNVAD